MVGLQSGAKIAHPPTSQFGESTYIMSQGAILSEARIDNELT